MGGGEKAFLEIGGARIADRTVGLLSRLCARVLVATPRPAPWAGLPVEVVPDALPDSGPLGGIVAGLRAARSRWVMVVAGDMPLLDERVLRGLAGWALASDRPVIPRVDGRPEPLHAILPVRLAGRAEAALHAGARKAWGFLDEDEVEWVDLLGRAALSARSVNSPADVAALHEAALRGDTSGP